MSLKSENVLSRLEATLDGVVSPGARQAMLQSALTSWGRRPELDDEWSEFVQGPLRLALEQGLGVVMAEVIEAELMTVIPPGLRARGRRRSTPSFRPGPPTARAARRSYPTLAAVSNVAQDLVTTERPRPSENYPASGSGPIVHDDSSLELSLPPASAPGAPIGRICLRSTTGGDTRPLLALLEGSVPPTRRAASHLPAVRVLIASNDQETNVLLRSLLEEAGGGAPLRSLRELLLYMDQPVHPNLLFIDASHPSVRPAAVAALMLELPEDLQIALSGASPSLRELLTRISPLTSTWHFISPETTSDLVELFSDMLTA